MNSEEDHDLPISASIPKKQTAKSLKSKSTQKKPTSEFTPISDALAVADLQIEAVEAPDSTAMP